jgi:hypothetical protein
MSQHPIGLQPEQPNAHNGCMLQSAESRDCLSGVVVVTSKKDISRVPRSPCRLELGHLQSYEGHRGFVAQFSRAYKGVDSFISGKEGELTKPFGRRYKDPFAQSRCRHGVAKPFLEPVWIAPSTGVPERRVALAAFSYIRLGQTAPLREGHTTLCPHGELPLVDGGRHITRTLPAGIITHRKTETCVCEKLG